MLTIIFSNIFMKKMKNQSITLNIASTVTGSVADIRAPNVKDTSIGIS